MNSRRPTLKDSSDPGLSYTATYFRVLLATAHIRQLIHGKLKDHGNVCAIGAYFQEADIPINSQATEEIASYNDSFPHLSPHERWKEVRKWLRFQVAQMKKPRMKGDH